MKYLLILIYCLSSLYSFSQIDKKDLQGDWYSENIIKTSDTIYFHNASYFNAYENTCHLTNWKIEKSLIHHRLHPNCINPVDLIRSRPWPNTFKIKKFDFG